MANGWTAQVPHPPGDTSGSGSSGTSAAEKAKAEALALEAAMASFREILRRWGIPASKNMLNLIQKAATAGWNTTLFVDKLRHTPDYHAKFPGIRYGEAMTEATYNAQYKSYRDLARSIGEHFTRDNFARAIKKGVTPDLFKARITAIDSLEKWSPMIEGFKQVLEANGLVDRAANVSKKTLMDMAMGIGPKQWEQLWQETVVGVNLERVAGVTVGQPPEGWGTDAPNKRAGGSPQSNVDHDWMHISRQDMLTIINQVEALTPGFEVEGISGQQWRDIGLRMRQFRGTDLAKYGITAKDLLEMELGGPRAAVIADKSARILKEREAVDAPRAVPQEAQQVGAPGAGYKDLPQTQ